MPARRSRCPSPHHREVARARYPMIRTMIGVLIVLSIMAIVVVAGGSGDVAPLPPPPPSVRERAISKGERREQHIAWRTIREKSHGCWSGVMHVLLVDNTSGEVRYKKEVEDTAALNFRVQVHFDSPVRGTWNVWNVEKKGDLRVVPLSQTTTTTRQPTAASQQLKFGFPREGLVVRIPQTIDNELARMVFEINFFDRVIDRSRRTVVVEYYRSEDMIPATPRRKFPWLWRSSSNQHIDSSSWSLSDLSVVQLRAVSRKGFVGNATNPDDISILPRLHQYEASIPNVLLRQQQDGSSAGSTGEAANVVGKNASSLFTWLSSEIVSIESMTRRRVTRQQRIWTKVLPWAAARKRRRDAELEQHLSAHSAGMVLDQLLQHADSASQMNNEKTTEQFTRVLPNGLVVSLPYRLAKASSSTGQLPQPAGSPKPVVVFVFGHVLANGIVCLVELEYHQDTVDATSNGRRKWTAHQVRVHRMNHGE